jgi:hypothetical protein
LITQKITFWRKLSAYAMPLVFVVVLFLRFHLDFEQDWGTADRTYTEEMGR